LLVRVEVHPAELFYRFSADKGVEEAGKDLESGLFDELNARVELAEFVVAPAGIGKYFDAVEAHEDVWTVTMQKGRIEQICAVQVGASKCFTSRA